MHSTRIPHPSTVPVSLTQNLQLHPHTTPKNAAPMLRRPRTQLTRHQIERVYAPRAQDLLQNAPIRPWCRNAHDSGRPRQGNGATFSGVGETKAARWVRPALLASPQEQQRGRRRRTPGQRAAGRSWSDNRSCLASRTQGRGAAGRGGNNNTEWGELTGAWVRTLGLVARVLVYPRLKL